MDKDELMLQEFREWLNTKGYTPREAPLRDPKGCVKGYPGRPDTFLPSHTVLPFIGETSDWPNNYIERMSVN